MFVLSFFVNHNSNTSLFKNGELLFNIEEERLDGIKYSSTPIKGFLKVLEYTKKVDVVIYNSTFSPEVSFSKSPAFDNENVYLFFLKKLGLVSKDTPILDFHQYHHLMHAAGAFCRSGFSESLNIVIDGSGSLIEKDSLEIESCYFFNKNSFKTIFKRTGRRDGGSDLFGKSSRKIFNKEDTFTYSSINGRGIVKVYEAATQLLGWEPLEAGKTMGLSSYGKQNKKFNFFSDKQFFGLKNSNNDYGRVTYPLSSPYNSFLLLGKETKLPIKDFTKDTELCDMCFEVQKQTQEEILRFILKCLDNKNTKNVTISGGYGLNVVANAFLKKELLKRNINFFADPLCSDCGISSSAGMFYNNYLLNLDIDYSLDRNINYGFDYSKSYKECNLSNYKTEKTDLSRISHLLLEGKSIGFYNGRSENGPRALGNRSILFNPLIKEGKEIVNKIKKRESFRPFAGVIKEENFDEWFYTLGMKKSPFMMYALKVKKEKQKFIPSIVHVDGTCRIQTLNYDQNHFLYDLLNEFELLSEIPILLNTSLNIAGKPLVETPYDAIETLSNSKLDYLYLVEEQILISSS